MKQSNNYNKRKDSLAMIFNICIFLFFSVFLSRGKEENEEEVAEAVENGEFAI